MVFRYQLSDLEGRLLQGEILSGLLEPQPEHPGKVIQSEALDLQITLVSHPKIVILTPDCDLLTDFLARKDPGTAKETKLLQHVQCCDVYEEYEIRRARNLASDLWKRVKQNQDERYHCLPSNETDVGGKANQPALFLDFKQMFSIPTEFLYKAIEIGDVKRQGVIPPIWLHSLIQRYFAFHSRVGVPDPNDRRLQQ